MQSIPDTAANSKRPTRRALSTRLARVHNGHRWEAQNDWYRAEEDVACRRVEAEWARMARMKDEGGMMNETASVPIASFTMHPSPLSSEEDERLRWHYWEQEQALRDEDERQEQEN